MNTVSISEAARRTGVSRRTISRRIAEGSLTRQGGPRPGCRGTLIDLRQLSQSLKQGEGSNRLDRVERFLEGQCYDWPKMLSVVFSAVFDGFAVDDAAAVLRLLLQCDPVFAHGLDFFSAISDEELEDNSGRRILRVGHFREALEALPRQLSTEYFELVSHPSGYTPIAEAPYAYSHAAQRVEGVNLCCEYTMALAAKLRDFAHLVLDGDDVAGVCGRIPEALKVLALAVPTLCRNQLRRKDAEGTSIIFTTRSRSASADSDQPREVNHSKLAEYLGVSRTTWHRWIGSPETKSKLEALRIRFAEKSGAAGSQSQGQSEDIEEVFRERQNLVIQEADSTDTARQYKDLLPQSAFYAKPGSDLVYYLCCKPEKAALVVSEFVNHDELRTLNEQDTEEVLALITNGRCKPLLNHEVLKKIPR